MTDCHTQQCSRCGYNKVINQDHCGLHTPGPQGHLERVIVDGCGQPGCRPRQTERGRSRSPLPPTSTDFRRRSPPRGPTSTSGNRSQQIARGDTAAISTQNRPATRQDGRQNLTNIYAPGASITQYFDAANPHGWMLPDPIQGPPSLAPRSTAGPTTAQARTQNTLAPIRPNTSSATDKLPSLFQAVHVSNSQPLAGVAATAPAPTREPPPLANQPIAGRSATQRRGASPSGSVPASIDTPATAVSQTRVPGNTLNAPHQHRPSVPVPYQQTQVPIPTNSPLPEPKMKALVQWTPTEDAKVLVIDKLGYHAEHMVVHLAGRNWKAIQQRCSLLKRDARWGDRAKSDPAYRGWVPPDHTPSAFNPNQNYRRGPDGGGGSGGAATGMNTVAPAR